MTCDTYKDQPENYEKENIIALEEILDWSDTGLNNLSFFEIIMHEELKDI